MTLPPRPPGLQAIFDQLAAGSAPRSLDALNRQLARQMQAYNAAPQAELGGLSPEQMHQLLSGDWAETGAMRVADDLPIELLRDVPLFADVRSVLRYIAEHAPVALTTRGNLTRAAVADLVPTLRILSDRDGDADAGDRVPLPPQPIRNEGDAHWLVVIRHLLLMAKLVAKRKGLVISARGRKLLDDAQAGTLYALLFRTLFQRLDLRFLSNDDAHAGLQATIAWSFQQIAQGPSDWQTPQALAAHAWLDTARDLLPVDDPRLRYEHYTFMHRVLDPLHLFGLLERRRVRGAQWWQDSFDYRRSALFGRVLRFEWQRGPMRLV